MKKIERIAEGYFFAKKYIIKKGYANEIDWQDAIQIDDLTEGRFLEQYTWVVLASGMSDQVVRKIFPKVKKALYGISSKAVVKNKMECYKDCIAIINHPGKIKAIIGTICLVNDSFEFIRSRLKQDGLNFIRTLPYMGAATSYHLAKNIGMEVAKPDRHLVRMTNLLGYTDVNVFCRTLSSTIAEKVSLIDLVLWRYATLDKNYEKNISWFISKQHIIE